MNLVTKKSTRRSCQERLAAFAKHQTADPADYETRDILPKETP